MRLSEAARAVRDERSSMVDKANKAPVYPAVQDVDVWKEDYLKDGPDGSKAGSLKEQAHTAEQLKILDQMKQKEAQLNAGGSGLHAAEAE